MQLNHRLVHTQKMTCILTSTRCLNAGFFCACFWIPEYRPKKKNKIVDCKDFNARNSTQIA